MNTSTAARPFAGSFFTSVLVTVGPLASLVAVDAWLRSQNLADIAGVALFIVAAFWSPLWFSIPALLLQDARDAALVQWNSVVARIGRGLVLVPHLILSRTSPVRTEMTLSVIGFAVALVWLVTQR